MLRIKLILLLLLLGHITFSNATTLKSHDAAKVMIIMDASGSMGAKLQGVPKIAIARKVIRDFLPALKQDTKVGLTVYGHRRKGDCNDIEILIPTASSNRQQIIQAIDAIQPKGKTPLSNAVLHAAQKMKYTEDKAVVILVSDGKETCDRDPCKLGKMLKRQSIDFKAYVIGFDVNKQESRGLRCLAKNTGGEYFSAKNAKQLKSALEKAAKKVSATTIISKPKKEPKSIQPGLKLRAVLNEGGKPVKKGMRWWINEVKADIEGNRKNLDYSSSAAPFFKLKPGSYQIVATFGKAKVIKDVTITKESQEKVIVLNAGYLKLHATAIKGSDILNKRLRWWIKASQADFEGNRANIDYSSSSQPLFRLPQGKYRVMVSYGRAKAFSQVEVRAGDVTDQTLALNAGALRISARQSEQSSAISKGMRYWVNAASADFEGNRKKIDYSSSATPIFYLNAGKYQVVASYGKAKKNTTVEVKGNQLAQYEFNMQAGRVKVNAKLEQGGKTLSGVRWWVKQQKEGDDRLKNIDYSSSSQPIFTLSAGSYSLIVQYGGQKSMSQFTVNAGENKTINVLIK
jgi:Ca-activated chloride channel homolog